jgi:ParB family transcriptional regulator, chromosome partitioning protein
MTQVTEAAHAPEGTEAIRETGTEVEAAAGSAPGSADVIEHIDPRTLLVDVNARMQTTADKKLIGSVKDLGVLQPIIAVRTVDGQVRVRFGHRRTFAAIEAGLETVPVRVIGDERTDKPGEIDRLVTQFAENEHREGFTHQDRIGVVEQLALLDVSANQIAKRTKMARPEVDKALAVVKSELAKKASARYDLTLDQAAAVAEFEDEPETVKALIAAVETGQFDHVLVRARHNRADAIAKQTAIEELTAQGVRVLDEAPLWSDTTTPLARLRDDDGERIAVEAHATCPGHVAWVEQEWVEVLADGRMVEPDGEYTDDELDGVKEERRWVAEFGCDNPREYHPTASGLHTPLPDSTSGEPESEEDIAARKAAASAERKRVIAGNKAWDAAVEVRRDWLRVFLGRKTPPAGTQRFIATAILNGDYPNMVSEIHPLAAELFGVEGAADAAKTAETAPHTPWLSGRRKDLETLLDGASDKRLTVITLGLLLVGLEKSLHRMCWRGNTIDAQRRYLRFLGDNGYPLCDVERLAAGLPETDQASTSDESQDQDQDDRNT